MARAMSVDPSDNSYDLTRWKKVKVKAKKVKNKPKKVTRPLYVRKKASMEGTSNVSNDDVVLSQVDPSTPCGLHPSTNAMDISPSEPVITTEMLQQSIDANG